MQELGAAITGVDLASAHRRKRDLNSLIDELHPYAEMISDGEDVGEHKRQRNALAMAAVAHACGRRPRRSCTAAVNYAETENRYNVLQGSKQARQTTVEQLLALCGYSPQQQQPLGNKNAKQDAPGANADGTMDLVKFAFGVHATRAAASANIAALPEEAAIATGAHALETPAPFVAVRSTVASLLRSGRLRRSLAQISRCSTRDTEGTLRLLVLNTMQVESEGSGTPWALVPWTADEIRFASARRYVWKGVTPLTLPRHAGAALVGRRVSVWWDGEAKFSAARVLRYCPEADSSALCAAGAHILQYEAGGLLVAENLELAGEPMCWKLLEEDGSSAIDDRRRPMPAAPSKAAHSSVCGQAAAELGVPAARGEITRALLEDNAMEETMEGMVEETMEEETVGEEMKVETMIRGETMAQEETVGVTMEVTVAVEAVEEFLLHGEVVVGEAPSYHEGELDGVWQVKQVDVLEGTAEPQGSIGKAAAGLSAMEGAAVMRGPIDGASGVWGPRARVEALMSMQVRLTGSLI